MARPPSVPPQRAAGRVAARPPDRAVPVPAEGSRAAAASGEGGPGTVPVDPLPGAATEPSDLWSPQGRAERRLRPLPLPDPESLHPALWRAYQLARSTRRGLASGHPALDAQLPGGGWPRGALTELLLPHAGVGEIRLLAPCLAEVLRAGRLVMLFDPPLALSAWALAPLGLEPEALLVVYTRRRPDEPPPPGSLRGAHSHVQPGGDSLWALEQALQSGHVGAVLAWLPPRLRPERLRRLQLAAQSHDGPVFLLREWAAMERPSPAPLRLTLRAAGPDRLALRLLKRRGPFHAQALTLALPPVLPAPVAAARAAAAPRVPAGDEAGRGLPTGERHALDRPAPPTALA